MLGTVFLGEENINLTMIRDGWAWDYAQYNAGAEYTQAERDARAAKRGLWAQPAPLAPWAYRHPERYGVSAGALPPTTAAQRPPKPAFG